ncbi:MAG TPA: hypothetical protein VFK23_09285 [Nitrospirota bacterium]|nr:hypothetical protein [Nitrospirota bacterium]
MKIIKPDISVTLVESVKKKGLLPQAYHQDIGTRRGRSHR